MIAYAEAEFSLSVMEGEGALARPRRDHLIATAKSFGPEAEKARQELAAIPKLPAHAAYLWRWFWDIAQTRTSNGYGPNRLSRLEIQAWERDEDRALAHWERKAIIQLDQTFIASRQTTVPST